MSQGRLSERLASERIEFKTARGIRGETGGKPGQKAGEHVPSG